MKLVIELSEKTRVAITRMGLQRIPDEMIKEVDKAIQHGTQLPKGHGDLKDTNALKHAFISWSMAVHGNFTDVDIASIIYKSPTIVEADNGE